MAQARVPGFWAGDLSGGVDAVKSLAKKSPSANSVFLKQAMTQPKTTGGIRPSSQALARRMVEVLELDQQWVVELGPGTGVFTEELLAQGQPPERLMLLEANAAFVCLLRERFPKVNVVLGDARELPQLLTLVGPKKIGKLISGLPFRNFPKNLGSDITAAIGSVLNEGGIAVQFTYALQPPFPAQAAALAKLTGRRKNLVLGNMPPAFVWRYEKLP